MNTLREALQEYLDLRRGLGFKMRDAGLLLPRFVSFIEQRQAVHITTRLALEWAQNPAVQPAEWAQAPLLCAWLCPPPQCHRQSNGDSSGGPAAIPLHPSKALPLQRGGGTAVAGRGTGVAGRPGRRRRYDHGCSIASSACSA